MAYWKGRPASFAYAIGSTLGSNLLFLVCLGIQGRVLGFEPGTQKHCQSGEILYRRSATDDTKKYFASGARCRLDAQLHFSIYN